MAQGITAGPFEAIGTAMAAGWRRTARPQGLREVRLIVPLCMVLICGSFAAAALLQMRLSDLQAQDQAAGFAQQRAATLAAMTAASLDRLAQAAILFAADPAMPVTETDIRDIAVFGADGSVLASLHGEASLARAPVFAGPRALIAGGLALRRDGGIVAVRFAPGALAPAGLMTDAAIADAAGHVLAGGLNGEWRSAPVPGWPLSVRSSTAVPASWKAMLPLTLFIILGPALAGGWLAALFVGSFERQARARARMRALRASRPVETRLIVRLAQAERGAAEALRAKSEFIAHMSHELRTPLNAVIGFSEVIAKGLYGPAGHPKYAEYAGDIGAAGRNLHSKIGDILEFANIEAGRYPLEPERVELAALVQACCDEQQGRAFSRRIALQTLFCEPGEVRADPRALRRILTNLLSNALTYTAAGGTIRLQVRFDQGAGAITVTDSGAGFSGPEKARAGRAFQRFDRAGTVTGAGLGLAIAMELVRRMGGAMDLSSMPGQGSVMAVRLPRIATKK